MPNPALLKQIDINSLPKHIAIIMDGNGRWAKKRFLPRIAGHRAGVKKLDRMLKEDIRFNTIGTIDNLPSSAQKIIQDAKERTKNSKGMVLTLALSYGSRSEIVDAVREIASDIKKNKISVEDITPGLFQSYLSTKDLPEPDLLIRTSGELRISNFLLYQIAYAELYFTDLL